jgi:catechol 2,3-dioxygenase
VSDRAEPDAFALPAATRVGRVALRVAALDPTAAYYRRIGFDVAREDGPASGDAAASDADGVARASLRVDGVERVVLVESPGAPPRPADAAGLFHLAVRVPDRAALGAAARRLGPGGLTGASDHLVSEALYARDPEGNGVEVYRDRPRAEWPTTVDGGVAMASDPLDVDALAAEADDAGSGTHVGRSDDDGDRLPAGTDVGHVHLEATALDRSRAFYRDALGFRVRADWDGAAFLAAGDYHHHVGLNDWNGRSAPVDDDARGLAWVEFVAPADAVEALRAHLVDRGIDVGMADGAVAARDPDGVRVRVVPGA